MRFRPWAWQATVVGSTIQGEVERVTYESEETGFRVVRLGGVTGLLGVNRIVAVGVMQSLGPGTRVRASGRLEKDARHGERFKVESLVTIAPETQEGLEKYLGSGVVKGVGPVFAKRIVQFFGLETLKVLDNEAHRLGEVPGLGKTRVEEIRQAWLEHRAMSNVLLALQSHGASPGLAGRIVAHFGEKSAEVVQQSPYKLAIEIAGIGFKTADRLARSQGLSADHPERAQAGVLHELRSIADNGHCYAILGVLVERAAEMLQIDVGHVNAAIDALWASGHLLIEDDRVFLKKLHEAECRVATRVRELLEAPSKKISRWAELLLEFEQSSGIQLANAQKKAVQAAAEEKFVVITGGPGVGKTTLVNAILSSFSQEKMRVQLAAPTGRAAKRMTESTGRRAQTLHRLLEVEGRGGKFAKNADNPLACDLLIIDEASMIDIHLAASLLEAIPNAARVVVVGDADQLPSVGPGAFLLDLIHSGSVPVARLDVIFRQAGQSGIIENSHKILKGEEPVGADAPDGDFFIIQASTPERARDVATQLVSERIPSRFGLDPSKDVQVLVPMHKGAAGTLALNQVLQSKLNASGASLTHNDNRLRIGDKVLQTKNDYNKDVFNGDLGEITAVDPEIPSLTVRFEAETGNKLVTYDKAEISQLTLAYATSIHKSQGSEYPAVVIPLLSSHYVMLSRNLLYTAVTRAKKLCVLITDKKALSLALAETRKESRQTHLAQRLANEG